METIDPAELQLLEYNGIISLGLFISLIITIIYSFKQGGIREVIENLLLWFLLAFAFLNVSFYPVDADDEMTAGVFFLAFGVCRIAKSMVGRVERKE